MGNPMIEAAVCPLCGMGWCGRPCLRDPRKSNALLFKKDGTAKTLKERGLGWDDPPPKMLTVPMRKLKLLPAPKQKDVAKTVNAPVNKPVNKPVNAPAPVNAVNAPAKPRAARKDMAAYMRKRRAAAKALKEAEGKKPKAKKGKSQDFKG